MDSKPRSCNLHKIVILNPKGGCGKTTLATNLASYLALRGSRPTLVDCDPGGYSMRWLENRPAGKPKICGIAAYDYQGRTDRRCESLAWSGSTHLIVDLPAAIDKERLFDHIYDANSILIPIIPSAIDVHSATSFIAELLLVAQFDRRSRNLAFVANRTRHYTKSYRMLMRFLTSLEIPVIAQLRDSQNFVHAAANGIGICEMPGHKVRADLEALDRVMAWLDLWLARRLEAAADVGFWRREPGVRRPQPAAG